MPTRYDPYNDPYSDRIGELIRARGDIAARQALESGDIWGRGIQNLAGQLGAGVQQYAQAREQKKRDAAWTEYIEKGEWVKDPNAAYAKARKVWGPKADEQMAGLAAVQKMATEGRAKEDPEEDRKNLGAMATALNSMGDPAVAKLYPSIRALMLKNYPEAELPKEYDPSVREQYIKPIAEAFGTPKKEEGFTLSEGQVRYGPSGEIVAKGPEKAPTSGKKYEVTVAGPGGQPIKKLVTEEELAGGVPEYQKPETDIEARQIRAEERKTEREKEKAKEESLAAAKEADTQVNSAFSAMEKALDQMEKYSGTKAVTSPLEAANARQQYEAATLAFAATLARATGDNRISNTDRAAYGGLVGYTGAGSTLLNITKPELARERLNQAKEFFKAAAKTRQGGAGAGGGVNVTAPNGKTYTFPNQEQADAFKKKAGI